MELLSPYEFSMLEWRIKEKYIVFRFKFQSDSLVYIHKFIFFLILRVGKSNKLIDPLLNKHFKPLHKDSLELSVEFWNPDMKIGDLSLAELVNYFLNDLEFLAEDFFLERASHERLNGWGDDLIFVTD